MEKYVWKANEKLKGLQLIFLMRDIKVRYPSAAKETLRRNSKLKKMNKILLLQNRIIRNKLLYFHIVSHDMTCTESLLFKTN